MRRIFAIALAAGLSACSTNPEDQQFWSNVGAFGAALQGTGAALRPLDHPVEGSESIEPVRLSQTCQITGEQPAGQNKICAYNCIGALSTAAITLPALSLCPLTIQR